MCRVDLRKNKRNIMKTKENFYISLVGKNEEELIELYWVLKNNNEPLFREDLSFFIQYKGQHVILSLDNKGWKGVRKCDLGNKQEITIQELKEMLQASITLEQQLEEAQRQVKRITDLIEENKPKVGDWVISENKRCYIKIETELDKKLNWKKITNQTLIKLLENEI